jgi:chromosome partitioning protein
MPNIAFISPKGGVGKTTAALLLALGLAERGQRVAIIDSDPNKPLVRWAALPDRPELISVHAAPTAPDIRDAAREAQRRSPDWTIVDTEGSERGAMAFTALRCDLVLTPVSGSQLDLQEAVKAAEMVKSFGRRAGRAPAYRAVLSRIPAAIKPRMLKSVVSQLREAEVQILPTPLIDKEAFRTLFFTGGGLGGLASHGVWGADAARHNAARFVADVVELVQAPALGSA